MWEAEKIFRWSLLAQKAPTRAIVKVLPCMADQGPFMHQSSIMTHLRSWNGILELIDKTWYYLIIVSITETLYLVPMICSLYMTIENRCLSVEIRKIRSELWENNSWLWNYNNAIFLVRTLDEKPQNQSSAVWTPRIFPLPKIKSTYYRITFGKVGRRRAVWLAAHTVMQRAPRANPSQIVIWRCKKLIFLVAVAFMKEMLALLLNTFSKKLELNLFLEHTSCNYVTSYVTLTQTPPLHLTLPSKANILLRYTEVHCEEFKFWTLNL